jgi:hypothetical protein
LEVDYPSKHQKIPILDMKVWVETREREHNGQMKRVAVILYEFYSKIMASKAVVNARLPWTVIPCLQLPLTLKRTVLTQEVLMVMLHCSRLLPWKVVVKHVDEVVLRMQFSGYTKKSRYEVVDSALKAYRAMEEAE